MNPNHEDRLKEILKDNNCRITNARLATFKLITDSKPLSIAEILSKAGPSIDRVSVYRNLELFQKLGVVNRVNIGWKHKFELSEEFVGHHHHMTCASCHSVFEIEDEAHIDEFIHSVAEKVGFVPASHTFEIDGTCKSCAKAA